MVELNGYNLQGVLAPELGNLSQLRVLDLSKNHFSGTIPQQFGQLTTLEVLDLRDNKLSGTVPVALGALYSMKRLLLCKNRFEGSIPLEIEKLNFLTDLWFDENLTTSGVIAGFGCVNRKCGHWYKFGCAALHDQAHESDSSLPSGVPSVENVVHDARRVLVEQSSNLLATPINVGSLSNSVIALPSSRSSGSFPAVPNRKILNPPPPSSPSSPPQNNGSNTSDLDKSPPGINQPTDKQPPGGNSWYSWKIIAGTSSAVFLLIVAIAMLVICRSRATRTMGPWKTGLSGQLQKAFITGVPKLNRAELEIACEDFSNIVLSVDGVAIIYKGTLSSGVEIAVVSTAIVSLKKWSKRSEIAFRKKMDTLSRVNHKNFVNLIGYCEEDEPFTRMMVFEYAPNGTVFEHLHVKDVEHLDWGSRMRIIMGAAYCLQYMHDLNPPVAVSNLTSRDIFLTDDYAAKIGDVDFWAELAAMSKNSGENDTVHSELPLLADVETNAYSFGTMLLEIISGQLLYSEEHGHLVNWAVEHLSDKRAIGYLIDPTLKAFKQNELNIIWEVIEGCIEKDARKRPTMKEIVQKLNEVLDISPNAAIPRLSPLWWAELEILSGE